MLAQTARPERLDLVLHERHERRHHDGEVITQESRELVAERLSGPRGDDHQHVTVRQCGLAGLELARPEAPEAEVLTKGRGEVHGGHPSAARGGSRAVVASPLQSVHCRAYNRVTTTEPAQTPAPMSRVEPSELITPEELRLATRNHGLPLEALAYDVTPVGLHYLLIHYDIPVVDPRSWRLSVGGR